MGQTDYLGSWKPAFSGEMAAAFSMAAKACSSLVTPACIWAEQRSGLSEGLVDLGGGGVAIGDAVADGFFAGTGAGVFGGGQFGGIADGFEGPFCRTVGR